MIKLWRQTTLLSRMFGATNETIRKWTDGDIGHWTKSGTEIRTGIWRWRDGGGDRTKDEISVDRSRKVSVQSTDALPIWFNTSIHGLRKLARNGQRNNLIDFKRFGWMDGISRIRSFYGRLTISRTWCRYHHGTQIFPVDEILLTTEFATDSREF